MKGPRAVGPSEIRQGVLHLHLVPRLRLHLHAVLAVVRGDDELRRLVHRVAVQLRLQIAGETKVFGPFGGRFLGNSWENHGFHDIFMGFCLVFDGFRCFSWLLIPRSMRFAASKRLRMCCALCPRICWPFSPLAWETRIGPCTRICTSRSHERLLKSCALPGESVKRCHLHPFHAEKQARRGEDSCEWLDFGHSRARKKGVLEAQM